MWLDTLLIILGFAGLIWGADKVAEKASALAPNVLTLSILTIVAFGTSVPEFFPSAAAIEDYLTLMIQIATGLPLDELHRGFASGIVLILLLTFSAARIGARQPRHTTEDCLRTSWSPLLDRKVRKSVHRIFDTGPRVMSGGWTSTMYQQFMYQQFKGSFASAEKQPAANHWIARSPR